MKILKEIKNSPFKPPIKNYYLGWIKHGTPYFHPMGFHPTIFSIRKLIRFSDELIEERKVSRPYLKGENLIYENIPMVRRTKDFIFKLFGNDYFLQIGVPFSICKNDLGWKDKYNSPRFEWSPAFYTFFFKWQFCIFWSAPISDMDKYWEMFLHYEYYSSQDIKVAEETWGWEDYKSKVSTWDKSLLK